MCGGWGGGVTNRLLGHGRDEKQVIRTCVCVYVCMKGGGGWGDEQVLGRWGDGPVLAVRPLASWVYLHFVHALVVGLGPSLKPGEVRH